MWKTMRTHGLDLDNDAPFLALARRIKAEYEELPGLSLTGAQARRLWGLDEAQCEDVLGALVDAGFLLKTRTGYYIRAL
jgi:hypothetical protein